MLARMIGRVALAAALAGGGLVVTQSPAEAATSAQRAAIIKEVKRHIGKPYRYGAAGPSKFDCSGLVKYVVYRSVRKALPHNANAQKNSSRVRAVSRSSARAGDLVFFMSGSRAYHVGIYAGGNYMYDIGGTGKRVTKRKIWTSKVVFRSVR